MMNLLTKIVDGRGWLAAILFLSLTHATAFGLGVNHSNRAHDKAAVIEAQADIKAAKQETVAVIEHNNKAAAERVEVRVRDLARERQLEAERNQARAERDAIQKVLNAIPDYDPACRISLGDVRLLNYAAAGSYSGGAEGGISDPAFVADAQEQTPSTVTCRAVVSEGVDVRFQYNELAKRHDALVSWAEEHLFQQRHLDASGPE